MKRSLIVPTLSVLLALLFLVYAFTQKGFAEETKKEALAQKMIAERHAERAQLAAMEAIRQERVALQQKQVADSLLAELNRLKLRCK
jgi:hypothetical protein